MNSSEVIVVGAGPVGMSLALLLGRKNISVTVLEAGDDLSNVSRASTVHATTLEIFEALGIAWDVIDEGKLIRRVQYRDRKAGLIAEFHLDALTGCTPFPIRTQTDQSQITRIIRRALEALPSVTLLFGHRVTGVTQSDSGASVSVETPAGPQQFTGSYVVGTDGAHSVVRKSLGIGFPGERYGVRYLMILTDYDVLAAMPELAPVTYIADDDEACSVLTLPDHNRVVFHLRPDEDADVAREPANLQKRLSGFLPPAANGGYPVRDSLVYSLHRRIADRLREGRVLLAGDAAHLNNPSGGMGMNSGIHDAYMLGSALVGVLGDEISDAALDGYAAQRRSVALGYIHLRSDRNQRASEQSATARANRDEKLRKTAADPRLARDYLLKASMFDSAPRVQPLSRVHLTSEEMACSNQSESSFPQTRFPSRPSRATASA